MNFLLAALSVLRIGSRLSIYCIGGNTTRHRCCYLTQLGKCHRSIPLYIQASVNHTCVIVRKRHVCKLSEDFRLDFQKYLVFTNKKQMEYFYSINFFSRLLHSFSLFCFVRGFCATLVFFHSYRDVTIRSISKELQFLQLYSALMAIRVLKRATPTVTLDVRLYGHL